MRGWRTRMRGWRTGMRGKRTGLTARGDAGQQALQKGAPGRHTGRRASGDHAGCGDMTTRGSGALLNPTGQTSLT
jgi:hypothetical protein